MDIAILAALVVPIVLVGALLWRLRPGGGEGIESSLKGIREAKDVISDHAVKTISEIKGIGETVSRLVQQQEQAEKLGQSLKDLLQAPKLRGSYGETILEEMLDRILPAGLWERQYVIDGRETVDCVVRFKDVVVPIDAKFPRDDYMRYMEAPSEEEKASCWKDFERVIREKIASIESKYVKPEKGTSEFALMFIPSEAIYYETIAERNHLGEPSAIFEYAQDHHVLPVGPNTFYAFLQIVVIGIRNVEIIRSAKKLQEGLSSLQRSFDLFYKRYEDIGKNVGKAADAFRKGDDHIERYKRRLDETLQLEGLQEEASALSQEATEDR
ncbi:MAG: DNA recombination protein RmuC [Chloroflexi bacterium]|nr:DNA recombination protein RmuC [Chloroflexota bacterium]